MNNALKISYALIISTTLYSPVNALALSDLDTSFSVQLNGRERKLQCASLTISNGKINCTDGTLLEQIPVSRIKQLDIIYMGKEYNVSEINEGDIKSVNTMSMKKGQAVAARKAHRARKRKIRAASANTDAPKRTNSSPTRIYPRPSISAPVQSVIESQIEDEFEGWEGETIIKLTNGQIWQQSEYYYHYMYAYRPDVLIYNSGTGWKMQVKGIEKAVRVENLK